MAQGYYTLEEAAKLLNVPVDELKMMARKGDVRSFQDRGTWRFRVQDIQEMARQRGLGSEPDLVLGDSLQPVPKKTTSGLKKEISARKSSLKPSEPAPAAPPAESVPEMFDFELPLDDDSIGIGMEPLQTGPGVSKKSGPKSKLGSSKSKLGGSKSKLGGPKSPVPGPKSPAPGPASPPPRKKTSEVLATPEPGSDSDVRLVNDDPNVDFGIEVDSDVRLAGSPPPKPKSSGKLPGQKSSGKLPGGGTAKLGEGQTVPQRRRSEVKASPPDSGVRLVPMDSDSDVRIVGPDQSDEVPLGATPPKSKVDSDIRLTFDALDEPPAEPGSLTEEIDLDAELGKHQAKKEASAASAFPVESPFELSETDFNLPATGSSLVRGSESESSDFDLSPLKEDSSSPLDDATASDDFELPMPDEGDALRLDAGSDDSATPVDAGISLEQESEGSDEIDFTLKLDEGHPKTPSPVEAAESSSEFELTLGGDDSSGEMSALEESSEFDLAPGVESSSSAAAMEAPSETPDSSEFELTLDADESSSEFELTIDASGESAVAPDLASDSEFELQLEDTGLESSSEFELSIDDDLQLKPDDSAAPQVALGDDDLQTDLDATSGSGVVALDDDTGLEDSDFEIEVDTDADSSSQVVALEEEDLSFEEVEVGDKGLEVEEDFGAIGYEEGGYEEGAVRVERETVIVERDIYAAPWSAWPVIVMLPCVVVMFFIGLMGFELIQSLNGYQEPGYITKAIGQMIGIDKM